MATLKWPVLPPIFQSTSSARRTTYEKNEKETQRDISIHVLREEDDVFVRGIVPYYHKFQSTSSARRTTIAGATGQDKAALFQSTSSARRTTPFVKKLLDGEHISIHVLREEDDDIRSLMMSIMV